MYARCPFWNPNDKSIPFRIDSKRKKEKQTIFKPISSSYENPPTQFAFQIPSKSGPIPSWKWYYSRTYTGYKHRTFQMEKEFVCLP